MLANLGANVLASIDEANSSDICSNELAYGQIHEIQYQCGQLAEEVVIADLLLEIALKGPLEIAEDNGH